MPVPHNFLIGKRAAEVRLNTWPDSDGTMNVYAGTPAYDATAPPTRRGGLASCFLVGEGPRISIERKEILATRRIDTSAKGDPSGERLIDRLQD